MVGRILFFCLAIGILLFTLMHYRGEEDRDISVVFGFGLLLLSFPTSLLVYALLALVAFALDYVGLDFPSLRGYGGFVFSWIILVGAGYWQWFKLVPFVLK